MGFTVTSHHTVTYKVDGELRPDEVDRLNRLIAAEQAFADALNAAQNNKENIPELKGDSTQCGGLTVLRKTALFTPPAKAPLGLSKCAENASASPTSIATTPLPMPNLLSSLGQREICPSLLVRSSSLAPTDEPSLGVERYDSRSQSGDQDSDAMSTTCVADSQAYPLFASDYRDICLQVAISPGSFQPIWVKEQTTVAGLRLHIESLTRIPVRQQAIMCKRPGSSQNQELLFDWMALETYGITDGSSIIVLRRCRTTKWVSSIQKRKRVCRR